MCYSVYLSTDSTLNLNIHSTELVRFERAADLDPVARLLEFPHKWYVGSKSGCSCTFRHLHATELGFGAPVNWYAEEPAELEATRELYTVISSLLVSGHRVDCIDVWEGAEYEGIQTLEVSLDDVPEESFRLFENYKFRLVKNIRAGSWLLIAG